MKIVRPVSIVAQACACRVTESLAGCACERKRNRISRAVEFERLQVFFVQRVGWGQSERTDANAAEGQGMTRILCV